MYKFLTVVILVIVSKSAACQNSFSFNCTKDTTIECTTQCLTLHTVLPDIHANTNSYTVNQLSAISCFRGYVNPAAPGLSAGLLIDDRYSPPIDITFPFSFYGTTYTQLIASTNGFLSFDISKTGTFSHFGILKNGASLSATTGPPQDLPNALYDKALIMGPYHDLDPNVSLSTQQIKYEVIGTAPYRKWIISYYNEPLYTTACLNLNKNTHQIVLYETLGIVEVFIYNKEVCLNWNNGRAMIGMQDFTKTAAIMAPGRLASSAPWGTQGMNESWRFVPASGNSLFKKVELYTIAGTFVTNGNSANLGNNLLYISFPNVCPPSSGGKYLVKSYYQDPNGGADVIGMDTINISRGDPIIANITPAGCAAGSKGIVTVTNPVGANYEYSLDGATWQSSNIFNLVSGTYTVLTRIVGSSCISTKTIFVDTETFDANIVKIISPCPGPLSASIQIFPLHGNPQYNYSLDGGPFQSSNTFTNLTIGTYNVLVTDARGCVFRAYVRIDTVNLAIAAVTHTLCGHPPSGTIAVTAGFGTLPYTYALNGGAPQASNVFTALAGGNYTITVTDATGCAYSFNAFISSDVAFDLNPVINLPACFGNNNGSITLHPSMGTAPYSFALDNIPYQADSVFKNLAAATYVLHVRDALGCTEDSSIVVQQPNPVSGSLIITPATTCATSDGEINVKANGGVTPFTYSINNGVTYQVSNVFARPAGLFNIIIKDNNGCKATLSDTVQAINGKIVVDAGPDKTICSGSSTVLSIQSTQPVTTFKWTPSAGLNNATDPAPVASPADTTTYFVTASSAVCSGSDSVRVNVLHKPIVNAGNDTIICNNTYAILNANVTNSSGILTYLWTPATDLQNPNSATTLVYPKTTRPVRYRVEVTDNYGCNFKIFDDVIVKMNSPVPAFAGNDTVAAMGLPHQLLGSGGVQYSWTPAHSLNDPMAQNPVAVLQTDTRFYLTVTDALGCVGTSSVLVKVFKGPTYFVPNAFTPNGDGINDVFKAIAPGIKQTLFFKVFSRWGQLMFSTQNITKGWDGNYMGQPQPTAVYVWIIKGLDLAGQTVELRGTVTLIR